MPQAGLLIPGNIDLTRRPIVYNPDGSISTVRSMSFGEDGREILIPTISDDGKLLSNEEAIRAYRKSGKHLGIFSSSEAATAYAQALHKEQEARYASPLDRLSKQHQQALMGQLTNWGRGAEQTTPPTTSLPIMQHDTTELLPQPVRRVVERLPDTMVSGALGLLLGGPPGLAIGAGLPQVVGINQEVDNSLEGLNFIPQLGALPIMGFGRWRTSRLGRILGLGEKVVEQPAWHPKNTPHVDELINARNSVYHATDLEGFKGILEAGEISQKPKGSWALTTPTTGVSASRVPRLKSKESRAISFVIDRSKMPKNRPFVEEGYQKTIEQYPPNTEPTQNPLFEFEDRTYNSPIPLSTVKGIVVDKSALHGGTRSALNQLRFMTPEEFNAAWTKASELDPVFKTIAEYNPGNRIDRLATYLEGDPNLAVALGITTSATRLAEISKLAAEHNIPIRFASSGRELHGYRATLAKLPSGSPLFTAPPALALTDLARRYISEERKKRSKAKAAAQ
jgi:hypothetical protein